MYSAGNSCQLVVNVRKITTNNANLQKIDMNYRHFTTLILTKHFLHVKKCAVF